MEAGKINTPAGKSTLRIVHPATISIRIDFLFPDRQAGLQFVDDSFAGLEGFAAVEGGHSDPDGRLAGGDKAGPVGATDGQYRMLFAGFADDLLKFVAAQCLIGFIENGRHLSLGAGGAHTAFEADQAPAVGLSKLWARLGRSRGWA